jgi:hypothetical protein
VDATLVRVAFVVMAFFGGLGVLAYVVLLILMPQPGQPAPFTKPASGTSTDITARVEGDSTATQAPMPVDPAVRAIEAERRRAAVGYLLIALGVVFLLSNVGALRFVQWQLIWPVVLIGIGVLFLVQRVRP